MSESLRSAVIKLAHANPELRPHLLPILKEATVFPTKDALDKYLQEHHGADRDKHSVGTSKDSRYHEQSAAGHRQLAKETADDNQPKLSENHLRAAEAHDVAAKDTSDKKAVAKAKSLGHHALGKLHAHFGDADLAKAHAKASKSLASGHPDAQKHSEEAHEKSKDSQNFWTRSGPEF